MVTADEIGAHFLRVLHGKRFSYGGEEWIVRSIASHETKQTGLFVVYAIAVLADETDGRKLRLDVGPASFDVNEQVWTELPFVIDNLILSQRWALDNGRGHLLWDDFKPWWLSASGERTPSDGTRHDVQMFDDKGRLVGDVAVS